MSKTPSNVSFVAFWSLLAHNFLDPGGAPQKARQRQFLLLACAPRLTHRLTYAKAESAISWTILSRFEGCATARGKIDLRAPAGWDMDLAPASTWAKLNLAEQGGRRVLPVSRTRPSMSGNDVMRHKNGVNWHSGNRTGILLRDIQGSALGCSTRAYRIHAAQLHDVLSQHGDQESTV